MANCQRIGLDEIVRHFEELEDPRSTVNLQHPLASVVVIAVLAVLAGAAGPTAIAGWATIKAEFLLQALELPHGIPCKDPAGTAGRRPAAPNRRSMSASWPRPERRPWGR